MSGSCSSVPHTRRSRVHVLTASTTIVHETGNFTTNQCFPDCSVIPGNPSTEHSGQITWGSHELKRETTPWLGSRPREHPCPPPRCVFEARGAVDKAWSTPAVPAVGFRSLPQTTPSRRATTHGRLCPLERCPIELVHPDYQPSKAGFRPVSVRPTPTALNAHADGNRFRRRIAATIPRGTQGRSALVVCHGQRPSSRGRWISCKRRQPPYVAMCPRDA